MEKEYTKIRAAILLVSIALFVFFLAHSRRSAPHPERAIPAAVMVEVQGDIPKPGIYTLESATATAAAAAAMAGCSCDIPADIARQKLISGQSLVILRHEKGITIRFGRMPGAALLACGLKLDLNSASMDELLLIPQMRPEIAVSIVERRREKAWEHVDDLIEIRGVGPKTAKKLQNYLEISPHNMQ
ncbi:MAG: helix-hairpin-helix domain-containing protein [Syntrophobacteraceae bacterium]|jgi:DNA uptake protein ComE-like DNA-binding protein